MIRALTTLVLLAQVASGNDWPQWMGPTRNGVWAEDKIADSFPQGGPKKLWSFPVSEGYSGPAVADGRVFVFDFVRTTGEQDFNASKRTVLNGKERIQCVDAKTGAKLWSFEYPCKYSVSYACGPRCTPTVDAGKVYALGTMGNLHCLEAATGKLLWSSDFKTEFGAETPMWGFCSHPLIEGEKLICVAGGDGSVAVAFDKNTGKSLWTGLCAKDQGYCPPTLIKSGKHRQILIWHATELVALDPAGGEKLWSVKLAPHYGMSINAPQQEGDYLFAGGFGFQAVLLKLNPTGGAPTEVWRGTKDTALYSVNATPLIHNATLYGCCSAKGLFRAVDLKTGARLWETEAPTGGKPHGTCFVVRNGAKYFCFNEAGELILAELTREKYREISRAKLIEPTSEAFGRKVVWSHPAYAERCIFARNDLELACFSLAE